MYVRSGSKWNLEVLVFEERGKPEYPEKNLSEQGREPTTNSTHIWRGRWDLNPDHIGGKQVLSPSAPPLPPTLPFLVVVKVGRFSTASALCPGGGLKFVLIAVLDVLKASI